MVEPVVHVEAENIGDELHKVCNIVSCSSVVASSKCKDDEIYADISLLKIKRFFRKNFYKTVF